ncbi:zinc-binding dehydrogenase [Amycolatopsis sp. A1MSW2902]|uniref:zinc-binding dehydrogenase n=1 Tax=Amycolatopsis sp. A1MSW2902 TaxID=687413 RepID=UPI00307EDE71
MNVQAGGISEALPLTTVNLDKQARIPRPRLIRTVLVNRPQSHWAAVSDAQSHFRNAEKQDLNNVHIRIRAFAPFRCPQFQHRVPGTIGPDPEVPITRPQEFSLQATHEPFLRHGNPKADLLADLSRRVTARLVRPLADRVFPLADIADAHRTLESGGVRVRIVVEV